MPAPDTCTPCALIAQPTQPQIAGVFFTEGSYTKNTKEEVQDMVARLEKAFASQPESADASGASAAAAASSSSAAAAAVSSSSATAATSSSSESHNADASSTAGTDRDRNCCSKMSITGSGSS